MVCIEPHTNNQTNEVWLPYLTKIVPLAIQEYTNNPSLPYSEELMDEENEREGWRTVRG